MAKRKKKTVMMFAKSGRLIGFGYYFQKSNLPQTQDTLHTLKKARGRSKRR